MTILVYTTQELKEKYTRQLEGFEAEFDMGNELSKWISKPERTYEELELAIEYFDNAPHDCCMCGGRIYEWPDNDICSKCGEHTNPIATIEDITEYISLVREKAILATEEIPDIYAK